MGLADKGAACVASRVDPGVSTPALCFTACYSHFLACDVEHFMLCNAVCFTACYSHFLACDVDHFMLCNAVCFTLCYFERGMACYKL